MFRDFVTTGRYLHHEYLRRNTRPPEPPEQPRRGLRRVIGQSLIAIGERLMMPDQRPRPLDDAA